MQIKNKKVASEQIQYMDLFKPDIKDKKIHEMVDLIKQVDEKEVQEFIKYHILVNAIRGVKSDNILTIAYHLAQSSDSMAKFYVRMVAQMSKYQYKEAYSQQLVVYA